MTELSELKTVAELIAELSKFPPDMPVMVYDFQRDDEWVPDPVVKVVKVRVANYEDWPRYLYPRSTDTETIDIVSIELS